MTTGVELTTFITALNGGATIDADLLAVLVDNGKAVLEEERAWMVLRKVDISKAVTTASTWQTAIDLSTVTDFSRLYGEGIIRLFDGVNRIQYYRQVPFDRRLEYKDVADTYVVDMNGKKLYLNGTPPFAGTLYLPYIATPTAIDLSSASAVWTTFPSRFLAVVGYYAIGIYKGGVDYDSINRLMLPTTAATLQSLKNAMELWDMNLQQSDIDQNDPSGQDTYPRAGAIDRYGN